MLFALLAFGTVLAPEAVRPTSGNPHTIYEVESSAVPAATSAFLFIEEKRLVADYIKGNMSTNALNPPTLHGYSQTFVGDVIGISFNQMSVPIDIATRKQKWTYDSNSCVSTPNGRDGRLSFLVVCTSSKIQPNSHIVYRYELQRGDYRLFCTLLLRKALLV
jgi:hypothetical protein